MWTVLETILLGIVLLYSSVSNTPPLTLYYIIYKGNSSF